MLDEDENLPEELAGEVHLDHLSSFLPGTRS